MVDGIKNTSGVNNNIQIDNLNPTSGSEPKVKMSSFGNGFPTGISTGIDRDIPGLNFLKDKFLDVGLLKYTKNVGQLVIDDKDFMNMKDKVYEQEEQFCEC
jgi:hypothetical protein